MDSGEPVSDIDKAQILEHLRCELALLRALAVSPDGFQAARSAQIAKRVRHSSLAMTLGLDDAADAAVT